MDVKIGELDKSAVTKLSVRRVSRILGPAAQPAQVRIFFPRK